MDITSLYKACIKTVKTKNKALGLLEGDKHSILPCARTKRTKSEFTIKAKDLMASITKMRDFLLEHRKDYVNANHLMYDASNMTDYERDQIDSSVQNFIQTCADVIRTMRQTVKKSTISPQAREHSQAVINLLDNYLKAVCKIYSEQKAIRVKRAFDKQKMLRLEPDTKKPRLSSGSEGESTNVQSKLEDSSSRPNHWKESFGEQSAMFGDNLDLSPEEIQMFEKENKRLYEEMNTLVDEVRQIEGKVVEISRLQEILSEKVLQQEHDMTMISELVVGTTENIKEGNEELREAMKKNAGFRLWILFLLLMLSFSLLFLDWYNP